jgi:hypothetical protein
MDRSFYNFPFQSILYIPITARTSTQLVTDTSHHIAQHHKEHTEAPHLEHVEVPHLQVEVYTVYSVSVLETASIEHSHTITFPLASFSVCKG